MTQRVVNYTYGTGNPVLPNGSIDVRDGIDNLQSMDVLMNAPEDTYNQRDGKIVRTVAGMNNEFDTMIVGMNSEFDTNILNMGFTRIGTFSAGATITNPRQTLLWDVADGGDGQEYGWSGSFPKVVPSTSTPASTGGISVGAWISRFDPELRIQAREALRRSYAEAGYTLVAGSFEAGGTLVNTNDVLLQERTGKAFSGPAGPVAAGTNPAGGGFVDMSPIAPGAGVVRDGRFALRDFVSVKDFGAVGDGVNDDTDAVQEAINYACAIHTKLYLPTGIYKVTRALVVHVPASGAGSVIIEGDGVRSVIRQEGVGQAGIIFSSVNFILHGHIRDITVDCSAQSSHGIVIGSGLGDCTFVSIDIKVANPEASCWFGDFRSDAKSRLGVYMTQWRGGTWKLAENSNAHGFHILTRGSYFNQNTISDVVPYFATNKQFFCFESTGDRIIGNEFKNITFEVCKGGGFLFDTLFECNFSNIVFYDIFTEYTNDLFRCTRGTSAAQSSNCTFTGLSRVGGSMASGCYDFFSDNLVYSTFVNCHPLYGGAPKIELSDFPNTIIGLTPAMLSKSTGINNCTHLSYESGIKFPGSEKYFTHKTGTWTAALTGYGGRPTTPVTATGSYTLNGNVVTATVDFNLVNTTGAYGRIAITGLPFKAHGTSRQIGLVAHSGMSSVVNMCAVLEANAAEVFMSDSSTLSQATFTAGAGKSLLLSISYITG